MEAINMLDLQAEFRHIKDDVRAAIENVLEHQWFVGGPEVQQLEEKLAAMCGCKFAAAISSGTDALLCALMSLGIEAGDEVITTPFTFFATAGCIHRLGATPVFVDIEPDTFNINPKLLESAITAKTKVILPVHLFGQCAEMDVINDIAVRNGNLPVLEDAAQAIGSTYRDRPAGSLATAAAMSFYPTKNLGGFGEGGMIVTDDESLVERCRMTRNHGETSRYHHAFVGGNFRLDTMKCAILLAKLPHLAGFQAARVHNAARYGALLADSPVQTPAIRPHNKSCFHQYSILCDRRDELMAHLKECKVGCGVYYPIPLHMQECFKPLGYEESDFPVSMEVAGRILSLPIHPMLSDKEVEFAAAAIKTFFEG